MSSLERKRQDLIWLCTPGVQREPSPRGGPAGSSQHGLNELAEVSRVVLSNCLQDLLQHVGTAPEAKEHPRDLKTLEEKKPCKLRHERRLPLAPVCDCLQYPLAIFARGKRATTGR